MPRDTVLSELKKIPEDKVRIYNCKRSRLCMRDLETGEEYKGIQLSLVFPLTDRRSFLRVCDSEENEIGIIRSIDSLDEESRRTVEKELERIYFIPKIVRVNRIEERYGSRTWSVETERGPRVFDVCGRQSIRFIAPFHLLVKDIDGNRYEIPCLASLDPDSKRVLQTAI
ncbi:MAG TPA: DUF1854 domain-containing protein [Bacillota bacterium]|nr:DUF1854 domain-containing protein [Bacillota bacterium]HPZ54911.1 DUF1854 domain-containing protein [Bacillota bacterium]HQD18047.1 DUF1854 domain-containing protein [Bacillota bacterium]